MKPIPHMPPADPGFFEPYAAPPAPPPDLLEGFTVNELYAIGATPSLKIMIANKIKQRIINGDFQLGQRLSENTLSEEMGVSRTPVREALMLLHNEGLVEVRSQRGSFVFDADAQEQAHLYELAAIYECGALHCLFERNPLIFLGFADNIIAMSDNALAHGDLYVCAQYDHSFHEELVKRAQNPALWDAYKRVKAKEVALRARLNLAHNRVERGIRDHKEIVRLIRLGQRREAIDKLHQHTASHEIITPDQAAGPAKRKRAAKKRV